MNNFNILSVENKQAGFGLPEILVGLAIGLIVALVIAQVTTTFEGQKRSTGGSADAQTNGGIALYTIQRQATMAGFGLPLYSDSFRPVSCTNSPPLTVDHDNNPATPAVDLFPITIIDGGNAAGASDSIVIHSGLSNPNSKGGAPSIISQPTVGNIVTLDNNLGCSVGDLAIAMHDSPDVCAVSRVTATPGTTQVTLADATGVVKGEGLSCMGTWSEFLYSVANGVLLESGVPSVSGIVNIQAQYGISALGGDNQVVAWVDASGAQWGSTATTPSINDRKLIMAIRVAVVARNGVMEKTAAETGTTSCSSLTAASPTGLCAWAGSAANPAPTIDLSNDPNWQRYRYRVFETIIPIRNNIWDRGTL